MRKERDTTAKPTPQLTTELAAELSDADLEKVVGGGQASGPFLVFNFKLVSVGPGGGGTKYEAAIGRIGSCTATHD